MGLFFLTALDLETEKVFFFHGAIRGMQAVFGDQPFLIDLLVKGGKVEGADIVLKNRKGEIQAEGRDAVCGHIPVGPDIAFSYAAQQHRPEKTVELAGRVMNNAVGETVLFQIEDRVILLCCLLTENIPQIGVVLEKTPDMEQVLPAG